MKGLLILSEVRSGSTWVASLTNSTGKLGNAHEWLREGEIGAPSELTAELHYRRVIEKSSTDNGVFAVKIFPHHLHDVYGRWNYDFIERCLRDHEIVVVLLERLDRLGAAISATRAFQSGQWSRTNGRAEESTDGSSVVYDRVKILENILYIGEGMAFWRNYLALRSIQYEPVFYERVMKGWREYVVDVAGKMGIPIDAGRISDNLYKVQRDALSMEWRKRFEDENKSRSLEKLYAYGHTYPRTIGNLLRFLMKKEIRSNIRFRDYI